ncbi:MAG TPA: hypothetical protein VFB34_11055 [Chloroflexota bacterium]|nr:hypothetical protein [Chloroflexota bacterium]
MPFGERTVEMRKTSILLVPMILLVASCGGRASTPPKVRRTLTPRQPTPTITPSKGSKTPPAGVIAFGAGITGTALDHPTGAFQSNQKIAWVARFRKPAPSAPLLWTITRVAGNGLHPAVVSSRKKSIPPSVTSDDGFLAPKEVRSLGITAPGTYLMRYSLQGKTWAEGTFKLASAGAGSIGYGS